MARAFTGSLLREKLCIVPVYHARINFALEVTRMFETFKPDIIAVELPWDVKNNVLEAVARLPVLTVVGYVERERGQDAEVIARSDAGIIKLPQFAFIPVHPGEPFIEAIRLAKKHGKQVEFIDLAVDGYVPKEHALPDDEAMHVMGFQRFNELVFTYIHKSDPASIDHDRELCMATRVASLLGTGARVMLVTGYLHAPRIHEMLDAGMVVETATEEPHETQRLFNVAPASSDFILEEIPYIEYVYELHHALARDGTDTGTLVSTVSEAKFNFFKESEKAITNLHQEERARDEPEDTTRADGSIKEDDEWMQVLQETTRVEIEHGRKHGFSRTNALTVLYMVTKHVYEHYLFREPIKPVKMKAMMQYIRTWTVLREKLFPSLEILAMSAKNFVNEEYASIVLDFARMYPFLDMTKEYPSITHDADDRMVGPNSIFLRNRLSTKHRSWMHLPIRSRPKERYKGEWRNAWGNSVHGSCSYPPEDIVEEDFFALLRQKIITILEEKRTRTLEFTSSLLDGIDYKETLRKAMLKKIYVKEVFPVRDKAGSVVIIFDPDEKKHLYNNKMTWWAEHTQESDMGFYATFPAQNLIGPGIGRIELGGVVSIYPPKRIPDIWDYFNSDESSFKKHEILLLAAIEFANEKFIPYVAEEPPSRLLEQRATEHGKALIHIPTWRLSTETLDRMRYIHVLRNKQVRKYAKDYIFL